eukprot:gene248-457_t
MENKEGLSREQLLDYVKKLRIKIKKLEATNRPGKVAQVDASYDQGVDDSILSTAADGGDSKLSNIEKELIVKTEEIGVLNKKYSDLQNGILSLYTSIATTEAEYLPEHITTEHIDRLLLMWKESEMSKANKISLLEQANNNISQELQELNEQLQQKDNHITNLMQSLSDKLSSDNINETKNIKIEEISAERDMLLEQLKSAQEHQHNTHSKLVEVEGAFMKMKKEYETDYKDLEDKYEGMIALLQTENDELEKRLFTMENSNNTNNTNTNSSTNSPTRICQLETLISTGEEERLQLQHSLELIESQSNELKLELSAVISERDSMLEKFQIEMAEMKQELFITHEREATAQEQLLTIEASYAEQAIESQRVYKVMELGYNAMQERHEEMSGLTQRLMEELEEKNRELEQMVAATKTLATTATMQSSTSINTLDNNVHENHMVDSSSTSTSTSTSSIGPVEVGRVVEKQHSEGSTANDIATTTTATTSANSSPSPSVSDDITQMEQLRRLVSEQAALLQEEQQGTMDELIAILQQKDAAVTTMSNRMISLENELSEVNQLLQETVTERDALRLSIDNSTSTTTTTAITSCSSSMGMGSDTMTTTTTTEDSESSHLKEVLKVKEEEVSQLREQIIIRQNEVMKLTDYQNELGHIIDMMMADIESKSEEIDRLNLVVSTQITTKEIEFMSQSDINVDVSANSNSNDVNTTTHNHVSDIVMSLLEDVERKCIKFDDNSAGNTILEIATIPKEEEAEKATVTETESVLLSDDMRATIESLRQQLHLSEMRIEELSSCQQQHVAQIQYVPLLTDISTTTTTTIDPDTVPCNTTVTEAVAVAVGASDDIETLRCELETIKSREHKLMDKCIELRDTVTVLRTEAQQRLLELENTATHSNELQNALRIKEEELMAIQTDMKSKDELAVQKNKIQKPSNLPKSKKKATTTASQKIVENTVLPVSVEEVSSHESTTSMLPSTLTSTMTAIGTDDKQQKTETENVLLSDEMIATIESLRQQLHLSEMRIEELTTCQQHVNVVSTPTKTVTLTDVSTTTTTDHDSVATTNISHSVQSNNSNHNDEESIHVPCIIQQDQENEQEQSVATEVATGEGIINLPSESCNEISPSQSPAMMSFPMDNYNVEGVVVADTTTATTEVVPAAAVASAVGASDDIETLRCELETIKSREHKLMDKCIELRDTVTVLRTEAQQRLLELENTATHSNELQNALRIKEEELMAIQTDMKSKDEELALQKSKMQKLSTLSKSKKKEHDGLSQQIDKLKLDLNTQLEESKKRLETSQKALEDSQKALSTANKEVEKLQAQNKSLVENLQVVSEQYSSMQADLAAAKEESEQLRNTMTNMEGRIARTSKSNNEAKAAAAKKLSAANEEIDRINAQLQEVLAKDAEATNREQDLSQQLIALQSQLMDRENTEKKKSNTLKEMQRSNESLRNEMESLQNELSELRAQLASKQEELSSKDEELSSNKVKILKYNALVKTKTKELEAVNQQLAALQSDQEENKNRFQEEIVTSTETVNVLESEVTRLKKLLKAAENWQKRADNAENIVEELTKEKEELNREKDEMTREKEMTSKKIEKLTQMVKMARREKDSVSSSVSENMEQLQVDLEDSRKECDRLRVKVAELEENLRQNEEQLVRKGEQEQEEGALAKEKQNLEMKVKRLTERNKSLTAKLSSKDQDTSEADNREAQVTLLNEKLEDSARQLVAAEDRIRILNVEKDGLVKKMAVLRKESESQAEVLGEKVKRMKGLLAKSRTAVLEKDAELQKLRECGADARAVVFSIKTRLSLPSTHNDSSSSSSSKEKKDKDKDRGSEKNQQQIWCLLSQPSIDSDLDAEDEGESNDNTTQERWVLESTVRQWLSEGSTLIGSWPEPMQEVWKRSVTDIQVKAEKDCDVLRTKMEALMKETEAAKKEMNDVTQQFQAYKARAQVALRRVGAEDHGERIRFQVEESERVKELQDTIAELEQRLQDSVTELQRLGDLSTQSTLQTEEMISLTIRLEAAERMVVQERFKLTVLQEQYEEMKAGKDMEEDRRHLAESAAAAYKTELENTQAQLINGDIGSLKERQRERERGYESTSAGMDSPRDRDSPNVSTPRTNRKSIEMNTPIDGSTSMGGGGSNAASRGEEWTPSGLISSSKQSTSMFVQETERAIKDAMTDLRQENVELVTEKEGLERMLKLVEEQNTTLKENIRELEASLYREKEFNSDTTRLNAEYLVNILKKFLVSSDPNEKANLVPVLCSILHLRPEDSKLIASKWAVPAKRGLAGWFSPPVAPPPSTQGSTQTHGGHASSTATSNSQNGMDSKPASTPSDSNDLDAYKDGIDYCSTDEPFIVTTFGGIAMKRVFHFSCIIYFSMMSSTKIVSSFIPSLLYKKSSAPIWKSTFVVKKKFSVTFGVLILQFNNNILNERITCIFSSFIGRS